MDIIILILGTYAITLILTETDGPFGMFYKLRAAQWWSMLNCFICCSVYVGAFLSLIVAYNAKEWLIFTFGAAGGAIIINKIGEYYDRQI